MRAYRLILILFAIVTVSATAIGGAVRVPFKGTWSGETVSAEINFPIATIVAEGSGELTHLGRYTMSSPHTTNVITFETMGDQIFTAANGDVLTAFCAGFPVPQPDGTVVGGLDCDITGGTGRFEGASGSYVFFLRASPLPDRPGFATEARIDGEISF